jgi:hypothetical protein
VIVQRYMSQVEISREYSHRWDVRAHERVRIRRGPLPLAADVRMDLHRKGYRIFEGGELDAETRAKIEKRRVRGKSSDEWVAVLSSWVDEHVKGPESAPYVPGVRKVKDVRVRLKGDGESNSTG